MAPAASNQTPKRIIAATDKGFGMAEGNEDATNSFEAALEDDPSSATHKGFGAVGEGILRKGGGTTHGSAFSTTTC
jgi:hypothetical protein